MAVFIVAAFGGLSVLQAGSLAFLVVQLAGCAYLLYLGWLFLRHAGSSSLEADAGQPARRTGAAAC